MVCLTLSTLCVPSGNSSATLESEPFYSHVMQCTVKSCQFHIKRLALRVSRACPRGISFTWWGCYSLCFRHKSIQLPTPFYSVLVSILVFMAFSTVFHSMISPDDSLFSYSVLPVFSLLFFFFCLFNYISLCESLLQPWCNPLWLTGLKTPIN